MNLATYLILLALTAASVLLFEQRPGFAVLALMGLAAIKVLVVLFRFMEMRRGHPVWKVGLIGFTTFLVTLLVLATS